ncbi:MAG TPA: helix-hairpin-helix domain-containing protein [Chitinophagaceae bacterium]|nr:helix-hairpin-helix domain-containing protein [Chitinophagaceae bacterium]
MTRLQCILLLLLFVFSFKKTKAQEIPVNTEQQLENLVLATEEETEDDLFLQELEYFRKNPLNLNTADANELRRLRIITDLQIANLISYRSLLGNLLNIYELQAVPSWDIGTIKLILPFVTVATPLSVKEEMGKRFSGGDHSLLLRVSQVLEQSKGFDKSTSGTKYKGSPQRIFFRYRYTYKNLLQFGFTGDKDAGEEFFKGDQKHGFDFYSFHLFARKIGIVESLAIGDFTVNLGQGLIHWQSLAFKKSVDVTGIKRQSPTLRPYSSAGEFYFHRGVGITIRKDRFEGTVFVSRRKLSANFVADTVSNEEYISSFLTSGYHRTESELADRNNLTQTTIGGNAAYKTAKMKIGVNAVYYDFSLPVQKRDEPYNLYAISGTNWFNYSVDYSYTYKNLHFFGEAAADKNTNKAFVNGMLISVDPRVDVSLLYRNIQAGYQSINGNAFTENTYPTNEKGFFAGISIRPAIGWRIDGYADFFKFPWLKYLVDAPSNGSEFLAQLTYTPNKQVEIYTRFRNETKQSNQSDNNTVTNFLVTIPRQNWRTQVSYRVNTAITLRNRVEMVWYDNKGENKERGFSSYIDFIYKPLLSPVGGVLRVQYFDTDGYDSRIYAYENDVLYSYSIPAAFYKGYRYYATVNLDISRDITCWLRIAQTRYLNRESIGSGLDEIAGKVKTEAKVQLRWTF